MEPTTRTPNYTVLIAIGVTALLLLFCYVAHLSLVYPVMLLGMAIYLGEFRKARMKLFLHMGFLLSLLLFSSHLMLNYFGLGDFFIPVASLAMLAMLLFNDMQIAFITGFLASLLIALLSKNDFNLFLISLMGSLVGIFTIKGARTRAHLIQAGFWTGLVQVGTAVLLYREVLESLLKAKLFLFYGILPLFFNGFVCAFVILATSNIFEWLFGVLTNFSLAEMADPDQPLLKRMKLEAPGTFTHSLFVSNLAEAAAEVIDANPLLTRVGAYYHDIGKMEKAEYFTENQLYTGNKHEHLDPNMSRLVILNHVKDGVELAKKYKLNPIIIDFIPQHHGTGLIHYFYQRALEEKGPDEEVLEENFRYPGPKPQTKETALVMLADSVEGATRALADPSPASIDELVRKVINNRFIDGQLDESNLTLRDIEKICQTFSRTLTAMHHSRVRYPEKKNHEDDNDSESASEDSDSGPHHPRGR